MATKEKAKDRAQKEEQFRNAEGKAIGVKIDIVKGVVQILSCVLADTQVLYVKTLYFHWNFVGPSFYSVHELLEKHYTSLQQAGDRLAERIRMYDQPVIGSMKAFEAYATLEEKNEVGLVEIEHLRELVSDHEAMIAALRKHIETCSEEYQDDGVADLLTALLQEHQKMAWMLRSITR